MRFAALATGTATVLVGAVLVSAPAQAETTYENVFGGVTYTFSDAHPSDGARVTNYTPNPGQTEVNILASVTLGGASRPVKGINSSVFANENELTAVHFNGTNLQDIGTAAFLQSNVAAVTLPSSLTFIGNDAFRNVSWKNVVIPNKVTFIGSQAFYDGLVETVVIGDHVTSINEGAFGANSNLRSVRFLGPPPTTIYSATGGLAPESFETDGADPLIVHYPAVHAAAYGFPATKWKGYSTMKGLAPTITGKTREGRTLTARTGTVVPSGASPTAFSYTWYANGAPVKKGAANTLLLGKRHAGKRINVAITSTSPGPDTEKKTSAKTSPISSRHKRLVLSTRTVKKGTSFVVSATGLKPHQKAKIQLDGKTRWSGRANASGTIYRSVKFASSTKAGKRTVKVTAKKSKGKPKYSISTRVSLLQVDRVWNGASCGNRSLIVRASTCCSTTVRSSAWPDEAVPENG
ncbi:leucine-rich repeat domain-containing protein [Aeromicrobium sp. UC242_57]|uniref:leucine-rich repeat domain-containing protein n=1 Tax=Aeromicrobium sp. UC242_57 TaxID=3374624 RepID=UPI0037B16BF5